MLRRSEAVRAAAAALKMNQITPRVYWTPPFEESDRPVMGAVVGEKGTLIVEAGNSPAHVESFLAALAPLKTSPPVFAAVTHWHWDHVFGGSALPVPMVAHEETAKTVAAMAKLNWRDKALDQRVAEGTEIAFCRDMMKVEFSNAMRGRLEIRSPEIAFTDLMTIDLGDLVVELVHVGGDHSSDSTVVFVPGDGVVFLGDCMYYAIYEDPPYYTTRRLFPLLERLLAFDAQYYLPAHADQPLTRAEMEAWAEELRLIGTTVERFGNNHRAIFRTLRKKGKVVDEDLQENVEWFIAGLGK
ncbi:MAG: MBL fold metallo-hydrolase [Anaerolineaceae bacterium]|nr:MBL fold metallo-hydrolase [Anaerolineaceae bacterium]